MRGPILTVSNTKAPIYSVVLQDKTGEPAGTVTPNHYVKRQDWLADTYQYKLGYRSDPVSTWLGRIRPSWSYVWPTPYDAYGVTFRKIPSYEFIEHRRTINTTPWAAPWRVSNVVTRVSGLPPTLPLAQLPRVPSRDIEGSLINRARISVGGAKANLAMTVRELRQTASMIGDRTKKIADVINLVRRGNFIGAARLLGLRYPPPNVRNGRKWADNFLEYQYGWMPLIADTIGYAEYLADFLREQEFITGKGFVEIPGPIVYQQRTIQLGMDLPGYTITVAVETQVIERHMVVLKYRLKDYLKRELAQLQLLSPATFGWEAKSLSFVWDWVFKVGEYLEATDALLGLEFHSGSYTRSAKGKTTYRLLSTAVPAASYPTSVVSVSSTLSDGASESYVMKRELYTESPPPQFVVEILGTAEAAVRRSITSCALLRQRLSLPNNHFLPRK